MKKSFQFVIPILILVVLLSCSKSENFDTVKICIHAPSKKNSEIEISIFNMLNGESNPLAKAKLDSLGEQSLEFFVANSTFATLKIGNEESELYLEPGYELNISINGDDMAYDSGTGSEVNNYLAGILKVQKKIKIKDGVYMSELTPAEFQNRLDTLVESSTQFHQHFIDSIQLSGKIKSLLMKRNRISILLQREALQWNYGAAHDFDIPKELNMLNEIPYDSILLKSGLRDYLEVLHFNMNIKSRTLNRTGTIEEKIKKEDELPYVIRNEIQNGNYSPYIKDFLLAKNLDFWMASMGIGAPIDSLYSEFKNQHSNSLYLSSLESRYMRFFSVSPGQPAPQIKGATIEGDSLSLKQFKNKVIYIDVWASWCGPCVAEIPFAQKLQTTFNGNDSVVFLNISVDQDSSGWRDAMSKHRDWKGTHLINDRSIYKTYNITGIPRYILIDKNGRIANADAPRPSSKEIKNEIAKLLR